MKFQLALSIAATVLLGCSEEHVPKPVSGGGGIETGDFQATVFLPSGAPAARAMVWLVRSLGDTAPAKVLDSAETDAAGVARFHLKQSLDSRERLGIDAGRDTLLSANPGALARRDSAQVQLVTTGIVEAWIDSIRNIPTLFVPGSHFTSRRSPDAPVSRLRLPKGRWSVGVKYAGSSTRQDVTVDTVSTVGPPAWSKKNLDWRDSINDPNLIMYTVMYRDTNLIAPSQWRKWNGSIDGRSYAGPLVTSLVGTGTSMRTTADSSTKGVQLESGITSPPLPASGALLLSYKLRNDAAPDSGLAITITLADSSGNGVRIRLAKAVTRESAITPLGNANLSTDSTVAFSANPFLVTKWSMIWNMKYIELRQGAMLIARYSSGWYQTGKDTYPSMSIEVGSDRTGLKTEIQIDSLKLYLPK